MDRATEHDWTVCRIGGVWQWFLLVVSLMIFLLGLFVLGGIEGYRPDPRVSPIGRPDLLVIPVVCMLIGSYGLSQALRVRLRWNETCIQDKSSYFEFRAYNWRDLTSVQPTFDGVGRALIFGTKGQINMRPNAGRCAIPLKDIWKIEKFAREKLKENARTS